MCFSYLFIYMYLLVYVFIHSYLYSYVYIYIYIYVERERETEISGYIEITELRSFCCCYVVHVVFMLVWLPNMFDYLT